MHVSRFTLARDGVAFRIRPLVPLLLVLGMTFSLHERAFAEDRESPDRGSLKRLTLEELFNIEVTSVSSKAEPLSTVPAAVKVVTNDDIRRTGALSLPEALRYVPGLEVARVSSHDYAITARGFNGTVANKLLVLIDGRSVYTPLFSGVFWDAQDAFLEDVDKIEVIRGPGATIWGANAVNGVINVISKSAKDTQGFLVTAGAGGVERKFGGFRYGGAISSRGFYRVYAKGFDRKSSLKSDGDEVGDPFTMTQGGFRADWSEPDGNTATLQGDLYAGSIERPSSDDTEISGGNILGRWIHRFAPGSDLQVNAYYDRTNRNVPSSFEENLDTYDVTLRHRLPLFAWHDVVWGLGYRQTYDRIQNSLGFAFLPDRLVRRVFSGFIQDEIALADRRVHWTVGSKIEHNDYTGIEYQPSTRLAWTITERHIVWGSISRAVRTPSRIDRDFYAPASPPFFLAGGPGFDSEVLHAYEVGYRVQPDPRLAVSVAAFSDSYDRLRSVEGGGPVVLSNGLEGDSRGAEASANMEARAWWRLSGGYTYLRLNLEPAPYSSDTTQARQTGDSPRHSWFVRSTFALPRDLSLDVGVRGVGELPNQNVPGYVACDARLGWQPMATLDIAVVGQNLSDPRHPEFGRPATRRELERSFYGKATWRF